MDLRSLEGLTIVVADDGRELGRVLAATSKEGKLVLELSIGVNALPAPKAWFMAPKDQALAEVSAAVRRGDLLPGAANDIRAAITGEQP